MQKIRHRKSRNVRSFLWRVHHSVRRTWQDVIGQPLQHITDVARHAPWRWIHVQPFPILP